MVAVVCKSKTR